jgi:plastocyanin domain-containing protein
LTGFVPALVTVKAGKPVALVVIGRVERTCATEIATKDFGVNPPLPFDRAVTVVVTPKKVRSYRNACGMDMIQGELRVQ